MLATNSKIQADSSERVAKLSQDGQNYRLDQQLAQLGKAQQMNNDLQRQNLALQEKFNNLRVASAIRRENQELETVRAQQSNALAQAGLSTGLTTRNSGLGITRSLNGGSHSNSTRSAGLSGALASNRSSNGRGPASLPSRLNSDQLRSSDNRTSPTAAGSLACLLYTSPSPRD